MTYVPNGRPADGALMTPRPAAHSGLGTPAETSQNQSSSGGRPLLVARSLVPLHSGLGFDGDAIRERSLETARLSLERKQAKIREVIRDPLPHEQRESVKELLGGLRTRGTLGRSASANGRAEGGNKPTWMGDGAALRAEPSLGNLSVESDDSYEGYEDDEGDNKEFLSERMRLKSRLPRRNQSLEALDTHPLRLKSRPSSAVGGQNFGTKVAVEPAGRPMTRGLPAISDLRSVVFGDSEKGARAPQKGKRESETSAFVQHQGAALATASATAREKVMNQDKKSRQMRKAGPHALRHVPEQHAGILKAVGGWCLDGVVGISALVAGAVLNYTLLPAAITAGLAEVIAGVDSPFFARHAHFFAFGLQALVVSASLLLLTQLVIIGCLGTTPGRFVMGISLPRRQRSVLSVVCFVFSEVLTLGGLLSLPFVVAFPSRVPLCPWLRLSEESPSQQA